MYIHTGICTYYAYIYIHMHACMHEVCVGYFGMLYSVGVIGISQTSKSKYWQNMETVKKYNL